MQGTVLDFIIVILYVLGMIGIAIYFARKKFSTYEDYYLAGRTLTTPVMVGTLVSSYFGVDSLVGNSEMGFSMGISGFFSYCFVAFLFMILLAFFGKKIRDKSGPYKSPVDLLGVTYGPLSRISSAIGSLCYVIPVVNIMGMGFMISFVVGIPFWQGVVLSAVIATLYTFFGGMKAVAFTDVIQFFIIAIGLGLIGLIGWSKLGNDKILEGLRAFVGDDPSFYFQPSGGWMTTGLFFTYSITAISVLCEPTLFQRIFAANKESTVKKAILISAFIYFAFAVISVLIGSLAAAEVGLGNLPTDTVSSQSLVAVASKVLPVGIFGLFLAAFLAGGMSTMDSMLLVAGNNIADDLYRPFFNKNISQEKLIKVTRISIVAASIISIVLSFYFGRVMGAWVFVSSMLVNTTIVPLYTAFYLKKKYRLAGELSSLVGLAGTLIYYFVVGNAGYYDEAWGTFKLDITIFGKEVILWQEYNIFIILPLVIIIYFLVHIISSLAKVKEVKEE